MSTFGDIRIRAVLAGGVALGALALGSGPASAQSADEVTTSEDIIVTANRTEESAREVPMGVTAITGDDLAERNLHSFTDFAALVPGLAVQQGPPAQNRLIIRGLNAGGAGSTVGVYFDDSPIGSSNALAEGGLYSANSDTFDMQRIEVLRGPQGTLYGANTQGGLIKFVSNAPDLDTFSLAGEAGIESVSDGETANSFRAVLNLPIDPGVAAFRISAFSQEIPGYIDNTTTGIEDANGGSREGLRASFLLRPTEDLSFRITYFNQTLETGATPFVDVVGSPGSYAIPPSNKFDPFAGDLEQQRRIEEPYSSDFTNLGVTVDWDLGFGTLTSVTSYSETESYRRRDSSNLTFGLFPPTSPEAPFGVPLSYADALEGFFFGVPAAAVQEETFNLDKISQEFRLASNGSGRIDWQVGAFYTQEDTNAFYLLAVEQVVGGISTGVYLAGPDTSGTNTVEASYEERAVFGQWTYHFSPQFDVAVGARYAQNEQDLDYVNTAGLFTGPFLHQTQTSEESATTFSIAPRYRLNDDTLIYGRVASGYRPGGPNVIPPTAPPGFPTTYDSDSTVNYELGLRTDLLNGMLSVDVAAFHIEWQDIQILTNIVGFTVLGNAGTAESNGFEWAFGLRPFDGLRLNLVGSYIDATLTEDAPATGGSSGDHLAYVPDWSASLDGEYTWEIGAAHAFVGGTYAYVGERFTDAGTTVFLESYVPLPSYTTLALRGGVEFDNWRAEVFGSNLTDERGITSYASSAGGAATITGRLGVIQPRTIGMRLSTHF